MHVARVVVHAVVGLMLVLIARVIVIVFVVESFRSQFSVLGCKLFTPPVGDSKLLLAVTEYHCNSASN